MEGVPHKTTALKTFSWIIVATCLTFLLIYLVTGSLTLAVSVQLLDFVCSTIGYYIHERIWLRFSK